MKPRVAAFGGRYFVTFVTNEGTNFMSAPYEDLNAALFILHMAYLVGKVQYSPPR